MEQPLQKTSPQRMHGWTQASQQPALRPQCEQSGICEQLVAPRLPQPWHAARITFWLPCGVAAAPLSACALGAHAAAAE